MASALSRYNSYVGSCSRQNVRHATGQPECASDQWSVAVSCSARLEARAHSTGHSSHHRCRHLCIAKCTRTRCARSPATDQVELFSQRRARALLTSLHRDGALLGQVGGQFSGARARAVRSRQWRWRRVPFNMNITHSTSLICITIRITINIAISMLSLDWSRNLNLLSAQCCDCTLGQNSPLLGGLY